MLEIVLLSTGLSTIFSVVALWIAWSARRVRTVPRSKIAAIELELAEVNFQLDALQRSFKRLNARVGMREAREKQRENPQPVPEAEPGPEEELPLAATGDITRQAGESSADWKRRARIALHTQRLK